MGRIGALTNLMSNYSTLKVMTRHPPASPAPPPCHSPCQECAQFVAPGYEAIEPCKAQIHQESSPGHTLWYRYSTAMSFS